MITLQVIVPSLVILG